MKATEEEIKRFFEATKIFSAQVNSLKNTNQTDETKKWLEVCKKALTYPKQLLTSYEIFWLSKTIQAAIDHYKHRDECNFYYLRDSVQTSINLSLM